MTLHKPFALLFLFASCFALVQALSIRSDHAIVRRSEYANCAAEYSNNAAQKPDIPGHMNAAVCYSGKATVTDTAESAYKKEGSYACYRWKWGMFKQKNEINCFYLIGTNTVYFEDSMSDDNLAIAKNEQRCNLDYEKRLLTCKMQQS